MGSIVDEIGAASFFNAFFSTISKRLEPDGWGSRFPEIMNNLYQGSLDTSKVKKVGEDMKTIVRELAAFPPNQVVWDIDNPDAMPPWGDEISPEITSLANYFVTSGGRDLFSVLFEAFDAAERTASNVTVEAY